jgi:hypothetical protein
MNKIKVGDLVGVNFHNAQMTLCYEAEVIYMPVATGDSWIFRDTYDNSIHHVSEGCTVTKYGQPK